MPSDGDRQGRGTQAAEARDASALAAAPSALAGGRTPEDLETLLEDALLLADPEAVAALFDPGAVLIAGDDRLARGGAMIAHHALATWQGERSYVASPRRVAQAQDIALIAAERSLNVLRRSRDGIWRYAIVMVFADEKE